MGIAPAYKGFVPIVSNRWRRQWELHPRIVVLQTTALATSPCRQRFETIADPRLLCNRDRPLSFQLACPPKLLAKAELPDQMLIQTIGFFQFFSPRKHPRCRLLLFLETVDWAGDQILFPLPDPLLLRRLLFYFAVIGRVFQARFWRRFS